MSHVNTLTRNVKPSTSTEANFRVVASENLEQRLSSQKTFIRHLTVFLFFFFFFCCPRWFVRQIPVKWSSYPFRYSFEGKAIFFFFFSFSRTSSVSLRVFVRLNQFITPRVLKLNPFDDVLLSRWASGKCLSLHCFCCGKGYKRMPLPLFPETFDSSESLFFPFLPLFFLFLNCPGSTRHSLVDLAFFTRF